MWAAAPARRAWRWGKPWVAAARSWELDISRPLLDLARRRAAEFGAANVSFAEADVQTYAFAPATFEAVFSRFGVMFFADPATAFANVRWTLKSGGRLAFVCGARPPRTSS